MNLPGPRALMTILQDEAVRNLRASTVIKSTKQPNDYIHPEPSPYEDIPANTTTQTLPNANPSVKVYYYVKYYNPTDNKCTKPTSVWLTPLYPTCTKMSDSTGFYRLDEINANNHSMTRRICADDGCRDCFSAPADKFESSIDCRAAVRGDVVLQYYSVEIRGEGAAEIAAMGIKDSGGVKSSVGWSTVVGGIIGAGAFWLL
ncbi:hypothetical protein HDV00_001707 [Rhizophlyctis rosea]|nr:hypothetical protein HDV00_001707 [Rhizophlyctis rosea]